MPPVGRRRSDPVGQGLFADALESEAASSLQSFNTFLLSGRQRIVMTEVPPDYLDPSRQKRPHQKSRRGCFNCRKRRVKCDEKTPRCSHCIRRQEHCEWRSGKQDDSPDTDISIRERETPHSHMPTPPAGDTSVVNILHLELFRHFETHTRHTLAFDTVWQEAIRLSLGCESLMHAILCLSAKHLAFLQPGDPPYEVAAATHLSQTLHLFQRDLTKTVTGSNVDCYLTTAILLSYIVWNEIDISPTGADSLVTMKPLEDRIFRIGGGTYELFVSAKCWVSEEQSMFRSHVIYSPRVALCRVVGLTSATINAYQSFFDYYRPLTADRLSVPNFFNSFRTENVDQKDLTAHFYPPNKAPGIVGAYRRVVARLCVILSFLPEMRELGKDQAYEDLLPDLARYTFSFPIVNFQEFDTLAIRQDPKWRLILYHFYRAARMILPKHFWWAQQRSRFMELLCKELLLCECAKNDNVFV